jgi:hypothetical protein
VVRVLQAFFEITLHRRGPDSLPASGFLFGLVLIVYVLVTWFTQILPAPLEHPLLFLLVDLAIDIAFIWSLLRAFEHERRFLQTAIAFFGVWTLLNLLGTPLMLWLRTVQPDQPEAALPTVLAVLLIIWKIDVSGFVIARALGRSYVLGVAIMLGYLLLSLSLQDTFFPQQPTT